MIQADRQDRDVVHALSGWLESEAPRRAGYGIDVNGAEMRGVGSLAELTKPEASVWGGWKYPECMVWAGALNQADLGALLDRVTGMPWRFPGQVQVLLMDQEESYFRLHMFRDGSWNQYAPPPPEDADDQHAW